LIPAIKIFGKLPISWLRNQNNALFFFFTFEKMPLSIHYLKSGVK
jgi:hypothetical protein